MQGWNELTQLALMGTASGQPFPEATAKALRPYGFVPMPTPETSCLQASALYAVLQKAARPVPVLPNGQPHPPCSEETRPAAPQGLHTSLAYCLQYGYDEIAQEFLQGLQRIGARIPEEYLAAVLDFGAQHPHLQELIVQTMGARGAWLARFNPQWGYALPELWDLDDDTVFRVGRLPQRRAWLERLRRHRPQAARELLQSVWTQEPAEVRASLLEILEQHISPDDEPFIDKCVGDKSKEVRKVAARLLRHLPQSGLVLQLWELVQTLVAPRMQNKHISSWRISFLRELTRQLERDGIDPEWKLRPYTSDMPEVNWLAQLLATIPPHFWAEKTNLPAWVVLYSAHNASHSELLYYGWYTAALRLRDQGWLLAINRMCMSKNAPSFLKNEFAKHLGAGLSPENFHLLCLEQLRAPNPALHDSHPLISVLLREEHTWDEELSLAVIERIRLDLDNYSFYYGMKTLLKRAAHAIPPALYPQLAVGWDENSKTWHSWQQDMRNFLTILQMRRDMHAFF